MPELLSSRKTFILAENTQIVLPQRLRSHEKLAIIVCHYGRIQEPNATLIKLSLLNMERKYRRLSLNERVVIETLLKEKKSLNYIAIQLNRNRTTVRNEVKLWVIKPTDIYKADLAHWCALEVNKNKRAKDKINSYPKLKMFIYRSLLSGTSPELLAGQLKIRYPDDPIMSISYESIYKHIYKHRQTTLGENSLNFYPIITIKDATKESLVGE